MFLIGQRVKVPQENNNLGTIVALYTNFDKNMRVARVMLDTDEELDIWNPEENLKSIHA